MNDDDLDETPESTPQASPSQPAWSGLVRFKDSAATIQSLVTVLGILAAAWWFFTQGSVAPHGNLTESVQTLEIHEKWQLVRLSITLKNVGLVPISLDKGQAYIARVLPLEPAIQKQIDAGDDPVNSDTHTIHWPRIGNSYKFDLSSEVWPGESETYDFDFVIPADLCEVALDAQLSSQPDRHLHWSEETFQTVGKCHVTN